MERLISLLGLVTFVGIAYLLSNNRHAVRWTPVLWGVGLQLLFALFILRTPIGLVIFQWLGDRAADFLNFSDAGAAFVFGEDFRQHFFAFKVLPTIIFFSAFISALYHYGVVQWIMRGIAWVMMRTMKTSGSESLSTASNIFLGPSEAPLVVKPYIHSMTNSELHAVMVGGFATVAGGVLPAYIAFNVPPQHLIAAAVMAAPASLAVSKLFYPETEPSVTQGKVNIEFERASVNVIDAIAIGTVDGLRLALNVGAMLIVFLSLVAMGNAMLGWLGSLVGTQGLSFELIMSYLMTPIAWIMGVPWADTQEVAVLLGKKTILNEFVAFADMQPLIDSQAISQRSIDIATYALCGFANIGTIGISIAGIGSLAPERQSDLARMGVRAMIAGAIANFMTASIAGLLL